MKCIAAAGLLVILLSSTSTAQDRSPSRSEPGSHPNAVSPTPAPAGRRRASSPVSIQSLQACCIAYCAAIGCNSPPAAVACTTEFLARYKSTKQNYRLGLEYNGYPVPDECR